MEGELIELDRRTGANLKNSDGRRRRTRDVSHRVLGSQVLSDPAGASRLVLHRHSLHNRGGTAGAMSGGVL